jgi:hypothetical protein
MSQVKLNGAFFIKWRYLAASTVFRNTVTVYHVNDCSRTKKDSRWIFLGVEKSNQLVKNFTMNFQWIPSICRLINTKTVIYLSFQIVEQIVSCFYQIVVVLNACMVHFGLYDYWKIIAKQCQSILTLKMFILPSHYEVKYPISYQNFRIWNMPTFDQLDSFSNFYFAHDESLKPFFLH